MVALDFELVTVADPEPLPLALALPLADPEPSLPDLPNWVASLGGDLGGVGRPVSLSMLDTGSSCFSPSGPKDVVSAGRCALNGSGLMGEVGETGE
jgi:hypothetical protein